MTKKKIIIATGGTGGHIFPAYSSANNLEQDYDLFLQIIGFSNTKKLYQSKLEKNSIITFYQKIFLQ